MRLAMCTWRTTARRSGRVLVVTPACFSHSYWGFSAAEHFGSSARQAGWPWQATGMVPADVASFGRRLARRLSEALDDGLIGGLFCRVDRPGRVRS